MRCSCVYVEEECGPEFVRETRPTARKEHQCCECFRTIKTGEEYERAEGIWEGHFSTFKTCIDCISVRTEFFCNEWIYTRIWDDLHEYINDCNGDPGDDRLAKLTPAALVKVGAILHSYNEKG